MKELIEIGGIGLVIPAVLSVLVLYIARGLFGLHGRRSQARKEFLELWNDARASDDLWLEVSIRHLVGDYLPAHVVRLALAGPDKAQSLFDLAELWPLLRYDRETRTVAWLHARHRDPARRTRGRFVLYAVYFICAIGAYLSAVVAANSGPATASGWAFGVLTIILTLVALLALMRDDTIKVAVAVGDEWIRRINSSVAPSAAPSGDAAPIKSS